MSIEKSVIQPETASEQIDWEKLTPEQRVWRSILISNCINRLYRRSLCAVSNADYYFINLDGHALARRLTEKEHRLKTNAQLLLDIINRIFDEEHLNGYYNSPAEMLEAQVSIINSFSEALSNIGGPVFSEEFDQKNPNLDYDKFEHDIKSM
jgi:hypothetical protein